MALPPTTGCTVRSQPDRQNLAFSRYGREVTKQLFPDQATLNREDNRRWELTEAHYDLPIRIIDPNGDGEE